MASRVRALDHSVRRLGRRELPIADFGVSPASPTTSDEVRLYDFSYDPGKVGIVERRWAFGDGRTSRKQHPSHHYAAGGSYEVTLTVKTADGRSATQRESVRVRDVTEPE
jgi:PKD repeat protein